MSTHDITDPNAPLGWQCGDPGCREHGVAQFKPAMTAKSALTVTLKTEALRLAEDWHLGRRERKAALAFIGGLSTRILAALPEWTLIENKRLVLEVARVEVRDAEIARLRVGVAATIRRLASPLPPNRTEAVILLQRVLTPEVSDEDAIARAALVASEPDLPLGMEDL